MGAAPPSRLPGTGAHSRGLGVRLPACQAMALRIGALPGFVLGTRQPGRPGGVTPLLYATVGYGRFHGNARLPDGQETSYTPRAAGLRHAAPQVLPNHIRVDRTTCPCESRHGFWRDVVIRPLRALLWVRFDLPSFVGPNPDPATIDCDVF